jgi:hypothetical protein
MSKAEFVAEFERDYYLNLYNRDLFDIPNLTRKFIYDGHVLIVTMTNSVIVSIFDCRKKIYLKGGNV